MDTQRSLISNFQYGPSLTKSSSIPLSVFTKALLPRISIDKIFSLKVHHENYLLTRTLSVLDFLKIFYYIVHDMLVFF